MDHVSSLSQSQTDVRSRPLELAAKPKGVDVYVVWRGAPKYLADCINDVTHTFGFQITAITTERRVVFRDDRGAMRARSLRQVRLSYQGSTELFCCGLMAVLEEIDRVCPWIHVTRLEEAMSDPERSLF